MVSLFRTTLVNRDGSYVWDAITTRSPEYDRLRRETTGRWFAADPDLERYSFYRAAVIAERGLSRAPAAVAARANSAVADSLAHALRSDPRLAITHLDHAASAVATLAATDFRCPWRVDRMRRLIARVHGGEITESAAMAQIRRTARRAGSLARWYYPVPGVDIRLLTNPVGERAALVIDDLRMAKGAWEAVALAHDLPATEIGRLVRASSAPGSGWRRRLRDKLWPLIAACTPGVPVATPLYALSLRVLVPESEAFASRVMYQPGHLRALSPQADWAREHLLSPARAAQAVTLSAERVVRAAPWPGRPAGGISAGVRLPGASGFQMFGGWRSPGQESRKATDSDE